MSNISSITSSCNQKSEKKKNKNFLLQNKCLTRADVKNPTNDEKKVCLGVTETPLKERFGTHT